MRIDDLENYRIHNYNTKNQLNDFVKRRSKLYFDRGDKARDALNGKSDIQNRQAWIREKLLLGIGGLPESDAPLHAKITGSYQSDHYTIEKIIFESRPETYVTANLYLPENIKKPRGAVLFLCGHNEEAKMAASYQRACQYLVKNGLIVLSMDPIGQGERFSYYESNIKQNLIRSGTGEHDYVGVQCYPLGDGLARYFIHDAMRAIDYLISRPEVDATKVGMTGCSGGGTQSSLVMMCDDRIAAAAPATFIMDRASYMDADGNQDAEQIWRGMSAWGFDHEDILLAMVPRPVLVMAAKYDFFPIEGTRRTVERARKHWEICGKSDHIELFEDDYIHHYTENMAKAAAAFFEKHLLDEQVAPLESKIQFIEPKQLWCTDSGQINGDFAITRSVHDENTERAVELQQTRDSIADELKKQNAVTWLSEKVFDSRIACELNPRLYVLVGNLENLMVSSNFWWSQLGVFNHAFLFRSYLYEEQVLPVTIGIWDGGTSNLQEHRKWIAEECASGREVMVLDVSGDGVLRPNALDVDPKKFNDIIHKINNDLIWLDDSIAALRIYDVVRALDCLEIMPREDEQDIRIYCSGRQGFYGQVAALLDQRIKTTKTVNGIESFSLWVQTRYYDPYRMIGVNMPEMLKYFDIPDLDRWLNDR